VSGGPIAAIDARDERRSRTGEIRRDCQDQVLNAADRHAVGRHNFPAAHVGLAIGDLQVLELIQPCNRFRSEA
jgi:hypothetical protein